MISRTSTTRLLPVRGAPRGPSLEEESEHSEGLPRQRSSPRMSETRPSLSGHWWVHAGTQTLFNSWRNRPKQPSLRRADRLGRRVIGHSAEAKRDDTRRGSHRADCVQEVATPAWRDQMLPNPEQSIRPTTRRKTWTFVGARPRSSTGSGGRRFIGAWAGSDPWTSQRGEATAEAGWITSSGNLTSS